MHEDRLRFLIKDGKWGLDQATELVKAAPMLLSQIEGDRAALKAAEYFIDRLKTVYGGRPVHDLDEAEIHYRSALSKARAAAADHSNG